MYTKSSAKIYSSDEYKEKVQEIKNDESNKKTSVINSVDYEYIKSEKLLRNNYKKCWHCRKRDHASGECPLKLNGCSFCLSNHAQYACSQRIGCRKCLRLGHLEKTCPRRKAFGCYRCQKIHIVMDSVLV